MYSTIKSFDAVYRKNRTSSSEPAVDSPAAPYTTKTIAYCPPGPECKVTMSEIQEVLKHIREEVAEIKNMMVKMKNSMVKMKNTMVKIKNTMVKKEDIEGHIHHALDNNGTIKDIQDKVTYLYERRC